MKKTVSFISLLLCLLMAVTSCGAPAAPEQTGPDAGTYAQAGTGASPDTQTEKAVETTAEETEVSTEAADGKLIPRDSSKTYSVLMVGNSFSYYNDMNKPNGILYKVAKAAGYKLKITAIYKGGYYLNEFLDETDTYGKQVLSLLKANKYDLVIIQEQSAWPISNAKDFYDCCKQFKELCDAKGAELWLYETWGYKAGHSSLKNYGTTPYDMEMKLRAAYCEVGKQLGISVAYAGSAFMLAYKKYPQYDVYYTDSKHPSAIGSTLIAYTLFGTIFGIDPALLAENAGQPEKIASALRECASEIVLNGAPVEAGYTVDLSEKEKTVAKPGTVDASKTKLLSTAPDAADLISVVTRNDATQGGGWTRLDTDAAKTFSGIRGTKDAIASTEYSDKGLTDVQKQDIADIGYGVSVIGIEYMDSTKKGTDSKLTSGTFTSVGNLCNGHWGSSYMAAMFFDRDTYNIGGVKEEDAAYQGLITLNFGSVKEFSAIGYFSGSLQGFAQIQDVYVSDDGKDWTKVESACYDATQTTLVSVDTGGLKDPWNQNQATVGVFFDMGGAKGQYIRIGIIDGGKVSSNTTGLMEINTREIAVFGK